ELAMPLFSLPAEDSQPSALCDKVYVIMAAAASSRRRGNWMRRGAVCRVAGSSAGGALRACKGRGRYPHYRVLALPGACAQGTNTATVHFVEHQLEGTGGLDYAAQEASFEAKGSQRGRIGCRSGRRVFVAGRRCVRGDRGADRRHAIP